MRRGSGAPYARAISQRAITDVFPRPVGKSSADGKSPLTSRSNNRRCQLKGLGPINAANWRSKMSTAEIRHTNAAPDFSLVLAMLLSPTPTKVAPVNFAYARLRVQRKDVLLSKLRQKRGVSDSI